MAKKNQLSSVHGYSAIPVFDRLTLQVANQMKPNSNNYAKVKNARDHLD